MALDCRYPPVPSVLVALSLKDAEAVTTCAGRSRKVALPEGCVSILPPDTNLDIETFGATQTCLAYLNLNLMSEVADEIYGRRIDEIDLHTEIGIPGELMSHLMQAFNATMSDPHTLPLQLEYTARAISSHVLSRYAQLTGEKKTREAREKLSETQLGRVQDFLRGNLAGNFRTQDLASDVGLSRSLFFERFANTFKQTPNQYLQGLRVSEAKRLLRDGRLSIAEVAATCGFADQSHLTRFFKRHTGQSPARFQRASR